jgi:hypothetical protein
LPSVALPLRNPGHHDNTGITQWRANLLSSIEVKEELSDVLKRVDNDCKFVIYVRSFLSSPFPPICFNPLFLQPPTAPGGRPTPYYRWHHLGVVPAIARTSTSSGSRPTPCHRQHYLGETRPSQEYGHRPAVGQPLVIGSTTLEKPGHHKNIGFAW